MICRSCEAAGLNHDRIRAKILSSPYYTGIYICGFDWYKLGRFHRDVDKWYQMGLDKGYRRFLMIWPRGFLKTTRIISTIVNWTLNDPECRSLLRMSSAELSEDTCRSVTEILTTSQGMEHFFPERMFKQSDAGVIMRNDELRVPRKGIYRESTLEARGIDSKITGGHFKRQVFDDLVDEVAIDSERLQSVAISRLQRSSPLYVDPSDDIGLIAGTRWPGEYYRWLLDDSGVAERYWTVLLGCYVDDRYDAWMRSIGEEPDKEHGESIWPEKRSVEDLAEMERELGPVNFTHQMLNHEVTEGDQRFRREDFRYYKLTPDGCVVTYPGGKTYICPLSSLYISMTIDPATGEHSRTDQSAVVVCGFDRKTGIIFVLEAWQDRVLSDVLVQKIVDLAEKWKPNVVRPEDVAFQATLKPFLRQEMKRRGVGFRIKPAKPGRTRKGRRILDALQPFVSNNQIHVLKKHSTTLVSEMASLQVVGGKVVGRSPNLADAFAYHAEEWRGVEMEMQQEEEDAIKMWIPDSGPAYGLQTST